MTTTIIQPKVFEGTWEEAVAQGEKWTGKRIRLSEVKPKNTAPNANQVPASGGSGKFEDIMRLVRSFDHEPDEESMLDVIMEERRLRRQLANEPRK